MNSKDGNKLNHETLKPVTYIYTYSYIDDELSLCRLEQRSFFGMDTDSHQLESTVCVDPSRSPFIKERIDVIYESSSLDEMVNLVKGFRYDKSTFKVVFVKDGNLTEAEKVGFTERRAIARKIGYHINGEPDLINPNVLFGIMHVNGRWVFGLYSKNKAIWLHHQKKPHSFSTSLSTRVARAVVNIANPNPTGTSVIDPCCGIGTVLVEGLSMGMHIDGSDINPLVIPHVRENLAYFDLEGEVECRDISDVTKNYDVAIIDMPYNLYSVITPQEQLKMLKSARRFTKKLIVITIEPIDSLITTSGFTITDRCIAKKASFLRQVIVCE